MNMEMIEVDINEPRQLAIVVLFLDQEVVQKKIAAIREMFGLSTSQIKYSDFENFKNNLDLPQEGSARRSNVIDRIQILSLNLSVLGDTEKEELKAAEAESIDLLDAFNFLLKQITDVLKDWSIGHELKEVLLKAVVCNEVHESDYLGRKDVGSVENISRNRRWFWANRRHTNHKSYKQISESPGLAREGENNKTVEQGVRSYDDKLKKFEEQFYKLYQPDFVSN